jgi:hypothetical protein
VLAGWAAEVQEQEHGQGQGRVRADALALERELMDAREQVQDAQRQGAEAE